MKKSIILTLTIVSLSSLANVKIIKKDMTVKAATIEATVKCIETDDYFDEPSYSCNAQSKIKSSMKSLGGTLLNVKGINSVSKDVLSNQVDNAGTYNVKLNIIYFK